MVDCPLYGEAPMTRGQRTDCAVGPRPPPPPQHFHEDASAHLPHLAPWPLPWEDAGASAGFIKDL